MQTSRAVIVAFHQYTPFGSEFYEPIYTSFIDRLANYQKDFTTLYLVDSTWHITNPPRFAKVITVDPHLRYYDAYKQVITQIEEKYVLFLDNDFIIWKDHIIDDAFSFLTEGYDVVSIYDTIGKNNFAILNNQSKFCPYFFTTKRQLLSQFLTCEWGPNLPDYETLGELTEKMLEKNVKPYEFQEDKLSIYYDGTKDAEHGFDLGYYHIRAGSTLAYLLATKKYGNIDTYWEYLNNQPKREYLRHAAWYQYMKGDPFEVVQDAGIDMIDWANYYDRFKRFHKLP